MVSAFKILVISSEVARTKPQLSIINEIAPQIPPNFSRLTSRYIGQCKSGPKLPGNAFFFFFEARLEFMKACMGHRDWLCLVLLNIDFVELI